MTAPDRYPDPDRGGVRGAARRTLTAIFAIGGGAALLLLLGVTVAEVVARHLMGSSLLGAEDLATMCLTVFVAGAVVCAAREGGHVSVDLIGRFGVGRLTRATDVLSRLLGIGATAAASLALFDKGGCGVECGEVTGSLAITHTPFYYALGASMATFSLLLASRMIRKAAASGEDSPRGEGDPHGGGDLHGEDA